MSNEPVDPIELFNSLTPPGGMSTNDFYKDAPKLRYSHEAMGKLLLLVESDLVVVPYEQKKGGWLATISRGNATYRVGGSNIYVSDIEIETAPEYGLGELKPSVPRIESPVNSIFRRLLKDES